MDRLVPFFCGSVVSSKRVHMCPAKNLTRPAALKSHCRCKLARMDESAPTFHFARPGPALSEFMDVRRVRAPSSPRAITAEWHDGPDSETLFRMIWRG